MRRAARLLALAACLLVPGEARAQVRGLPVENSGVRPGLGLSASVGLPNEALARGTFVGGTARLGLGRVGASATVGHEVGSDGLGGGTSVGGTLEVTLLGSPRVPFHAVLQGGAGYVRLAAFDTDEFRVPIGLGFGAVVPNPVLALRPWLSPRIDVQHRRPGTRPGGGPLPGFEGTATRFGLSGGLQADLLNGLGAHVAYDRIFGDGSPSVLAAGLHYQFRVRPR